MESYQEKARTLSERFGISPAAAMKALEESDGDILDAVIRLEAEGTIHRTSANYSTSYTSRPAEKQQPYISMDKPYEKPESFFDKAVKFFLKSIDSSFCISRKDKEIVAMPTVLFIILLIAAFKVVVVAVLVGLFAGCKYSIKYSEDDAVSNNGDPPGNTL